MQFQLFIRLAFIGLLVLSCHTSYSDEPDLKTTKNFLIIVISGFDSDPSPAQIAKTTKRGEGQSGMYQLAADLTDKGYSTKFFNWNGTEAGRFKTRNAPGAKGITQYLKQELKKDEFNKVILIGQSWGAHTMLEVTQQLEESGDVKIPLVIGIDPSSVSRGGRPKQLPKNIAKCVNYYTRNSFVWGEWKDCDRVENIDLGDPKNGYKSAHGGDYSSTFDLSAHVAAEWDEGIHKDVIRRIDALTRSAKPKE